jgi:DNA-binding transcriptional ArsR family regulator
MMPDPERGLDIHGLLDAALSRPSRDWLPFASELKALGMAVPPGLGEGRPETLDRLGHSVRLFHDVAVDPYWRRLNAAAAAVVSSWAQTMSTQGLEALLGNLRSNVTWRRPVLQLAVDTRVCTPDCPHHRVVAAARTHQNRFAVSEHGLTIVPSFFGAELMIWMDLEPERGHVAKVMAVPVDTDISIFEPPTTAPAADPLCELLGPTRSCVLRACLDNDLTTSALARMVGISQSSASEHASVLRAAGLISSVRTGRSVLHRVTPIGVALVCGTRRPVQERSSHRPIASRDRLSHPLG